MQFARDGSQACPIRWYFTDPGAPFLTYPSPFRSLNWWHVDEGPGDVLGEVLGADRPVANGLPLISPQNEVPCGTADQWRNGVATFTPQPPATVFGTAACCGLPPEPFLHFTCVNCPEGSWSQYTWIVSGCTGVWVILNGRFTLRYIGSCTWDSDPIPAGTFGGTYRWRANWGPAIGPFRVSVFPLVIPPDYPSYVRAPGPSCLQEAFNFFEETGVPIPGVNYDAVLLPGDAAGIGPFCTLQGQFLPSVLMVRWPAPGIAVNFTPRAQDDPLRSVAPCQYRGIVLWSTRIPLSNLVPVFTQIFLTFGAGGLITLSGRTPLFSPFSYTATAPMWDGSPLALLLVGGAFPLFGMPAMVTLYTQSDLPP